MGKVPLPGTLGLSILTEQKQLKFLLPSLKKLIKENKLFQQKLMACERPVGKCLGAARKALLLHRDPKKREMDSRTSTCCCVCLARAPSVTPWRRHFSFPLGRIHLWEGADITKNPKLCCSTLICHKLCIHFISAREEKILKTEKPHGMGTSFSTQLR